VARQVVHWTGAGGHPVGASERWSAREKGATVVALIIVIVLVVLVVGLVWLAYNGIVKSRNQVDNGWSQIDVQIKRRADLIPNLVETVKGYAAHERNTLEAVIAARSASVSANTPAEAAAAEGPLTEALGRLFALQEQYPNLKADVNFQQLQQEITSTEDRIAYARQFYNDSVMNYHNKIDTFPGVLVAKIGTFPRREMFEADEADRAVPRVEF
jgi:LemA protein